MTPKQDTRTELRIWLTALAFAVLGLVNTLIIGPWWLAVIWAATVLVLGVYVVATYAELRRRR